MFDTSDSRKSSPNYVQSAQVQGFSERGFVMGPLLFHKLTVAMGLNADEARQMADEVRSFVERGDVDDDGYKAFRKSLVLGISSLESRVSAMVGAQDRMRALSRFLSERTSSWYPPLHLEQAPAPARPASSLAPVERNARLRPELLVITGALGSGKSRLVNSLLARSAPRKALVFVNELGDEPVDHLLMREAPPGSDIQVMANGCLCCQLGADFLQMLREALRQRQARQLDFDWILVETSGAADPLDIVQSIAANTELRDQVDLRGVCTTVDTRTWRGENVRLTNSETFQLAAANWLAPTMGDLLEPEEYAAAIVRIAEAAPWSRSMLGLGGDLAGDLIQALERSAIPASAESEAKRAASVKGIARHEGAVNALTLRGGSVDMNALRVFVDLLFLAKGEDILRMKGDIALSDGAHVVLQAVKGYVHEVRLLPKAPAPGTRLTVIARNAAPERVRRLWGLVQQEVSDAAVPRRQATMS